MHVLYYKYKEIINKLASLVIVAPLPYQRRAEEAQLEGDITNGNAESQS
jgi:hypothetical protein